MAIDEGLKEQEYKLDDNFSGESDRERYLWIASRLVVDWIRYFLIGNEIFEGIAQ